MATKITPSAEEHLLPMELDLAHLTDSAVTFIQHELTLNSLTRYGIALAIAVIGIGFIWLIKGVIARWAAAWLSSSRTRTVDRQMAEETGLALVPLLYLFPLYFALDTLSFSPALRKFLSFVILLLFITRTVRFFSALASFLTDTYLRRHRQSLDSTVGKALSPIIRVVFWAVGLTILLDNMGFQISSLLAGLGIIGMAVGLAGQTILGDFFGYLVILMDKPFTIGDTIAVDGVTGTVETIGLKTTKIRLLGGEVLVCPNGDLTKKNISNYRLMRDRSGTFRFGVAYETPPAKVRAIPDMVRELAGPIDGLAVTRAFFVEFGDSSLNFEVAYTVRSNSFIEALAAQQELYLGLLDRFDKENIVFAYPTRTVYFANTPPSPAPDMPRNTEQ